MLSHNYYFPTSAVRVWQQQNWKWLWVLVFTARLVKSHFLKAIVVNDLSVCVRERENEGYQREDFVALLGMMGIPPVSIVYTVGLFFHVI